jgi:uncharacterized protein
MLSAMTLPLMPKATAVWLVTNTALTFEQIADFCGMHVLEVQGIADEEVAIGIVPENPIVNGQLTQTEIDRCVSHPSAKLQITSVNDYLLRGSKKKGAKYIPIARRQDKPDAVAWLVKNYPDISDERISKLLGTTKTTVVAIRNKEHWNYENLRPRDPVILGLCSQTALNDIVSELESKK